MAFFFLNADLVAKHEPRDSGHQLSEEDERQEHGVLRRGEKKGDGVALFTLPRARTCALLTAV